MKARSWLWGALGVVLVWIVGRWWVVPELIRSAYREESLELFNRMLSGRDVHPVERYLDAWYSLSFVASAVVLALAVGVFVLYRFPEVRRRAVRSVVGETGQLGAARLVSYAVMLGLGSGLGEAVYQGVRQAITTRPASLFYTELYWMAPLSAALAMVPVALAMALFARLGAAKWQVGRATGVLGFLAVHPIVQSEGIPLATFAAVLVAAGMASVLARVASAHAGGVRVWIGRSRPAAVVLVLGLLGYAWWALPAVAEGRAATDRVAAREGLPNIVLIIWDTVRAANLSVYGYERPTTPELAKLAETGAVFDFAVATAPWTLPTHATLFTGLYNYDLRTGFRSPLADGFTTLAETLADEGYATGGFTANPMYATALSGLDQGFARWEDHVVDSGLFLRSSWLSDVLLSRFGPPGPSQGLKDATGVTAQFLDWATGVQDRPFFAFLNYFDAHGPYVSPPEFAEFGPLPAESWYDFLGQWRRDPARSYGVEDTRLWVNRYDNAIRYVDHQLALIRDVLETEGLLENTIVVVTSDHGELWGEHGQLGHFQSLYIPSLHVPLVISYPAGGVPATRVSQEVSLRDVPATILDLAGLEPRLPGHSMAKTWSDTGAEVALSPLVAEMDADPYNSNSWDPVSRGAMKSVIRDRMHYIRNGDGVEELYDLASDPDQLHDLSDDPVQSQSLTTLRIALDSLVSLTDQR